MNIYPTFLKALTVQHMLPEPRATTDHPKGFDRHQRKEVLVLVLLAVVHGHFRSGHCFENGTG